AAPTSADPERCDQRASGDAAAATPRQQRQRRLFLCAGASGALGEDGAGFGALRLVRRQRHRPGDRRYAVLVLAATRPARSRKVLLTAGATLGMISGTRWR